MEKWTIVGGIIGAILGVIAGFVVQAIVGNDAAGLYSFLLGLAGFGVGLVIGFIAFHVKESGR